MVKTSNRLFPLWAVGLGHCYRGWLFETELFFFKIKNKIMKKNMGSVDRIIRFLLAAVFAYL